MKAVTNEVEKQDFLLNTFLKYLELTTPIPKENTVNRMIEEALKRLPLLARKIKLFKKYDEDLPETTVPDEQLRFIFDSLLQYAMAEVPSGGTLSVLTKAIDILPGAIESRESLKGSGKQVEITIAFTRSKKPAEPSETGTTVPSPQNQVVSDLMYRLVDMVVKKNQGTMVFEVDERESRNSVILKLPMERRRVF